MQFIKKRQKVQLKYTGSIQEKRLASKRKNIKKNMKLKIFKSKTGLVIKSLAKCTAQETPLLLLTKLNTKHPSSAESTYVLALTRK